MQLRPAVDGGTENRGGTIGHIAGSLMAAAMALPGLSLSSSAHGEVAPDQSTVSLKYLNYVDYQRRGGERMTIHSPSAYFQVPIKDLASLEGSLTVDSVSGASPLFHSTLSGASGRSIGDLRKAGDVKLTRYFPRTTLGIGLGYSTEHDYDSATVSVDARFSSADNNTTLALGVDYTDDDIGKEFEPDFDKKRHTAGFLIGLTRVLTADTLVQSNLTFNDGHGYFSDPYKAIDIRPERRRQWAWLTRLVRYFRGPEAALHLAYRYYDNSWGVRAHTFEAAWYQPFGQGWLVRPSVRYYSQRAARFYGDPPFPPAFVEEFYSADHRLSAFGAVTLGAKLTKELPKDFAISLNWEWYQQRGSWRLAGDGSPALENTTARWWMVGLSKKF